MEYICLDVETTGLSPMNDSIIEVCGFHIVDGVSVGKFSELIKPFWSIPRYIESTTGITNEMVKDSRDMSEVLPEFFDFCGQLPIVGYNVKFDYNMLVAKSKTICGDFSMGETRRGFDVYSLVRKYMKELPSKKLGDVADYMGISLPPIAGRGFHCAEYDAYVTKLIFDAFLSKGVSTKFDYLDKKDRSENLHGRVYNNEELPLV